MCIVCIELIKQKMTIYEAEKNLGEMVNNTKDPKREHYRELNDALKELDAPKLGDLFKKAMDEDETGHFWR